MSASATQGGHKKIAQYGGESRVVRGKIRRKIVKDLVVKNMTPYCYV